MVRGLTLKLFSAALAAGLTINPAVAKDDASFDFSGLKWRNLGPAFMILRAFHSWVVRTISVALSVHAHSDCS